MHILFHADDFGLSLGINETILDAVDNGRLESLSIVANGHAFNEAVTEWKKRSHLRLAVHLNLFEGIPICSRENIPLLVDDKGVFKHSFFSLWMCYTFSVPRVRAAFREQVRREYAAQLQKVQMATGLQDFIVDSHVHFHMIPFVFDVLYSLRSEFPIRCIRIPSERFFISIHSLNDLSNYIGSNIVKHVLLNILACRNRRYVPKMKNPRFIGVLFSGRMTIDAIQAGLRRVPQNATVEVLLHPGRAKEDEYTYWSDRAELWRYYHSVDRNAERVVLQNKTLSDVVHSFA